MNLFGGKTKDALITKLYSNPDESFHLRELVRSLDTGTGVVQREIKALTADGLILEEPKGNRHFYRANKDHEMFAELQAIVSKSTASNASSVLRSALASLKPKIRAAFVYGSVAGGKVHPNSDIDVMVIGNVTFEDLYPRLLKAHRKLYREINPVIYSVAEFKKRIKEGNHFLNAVMNKDKIFVVGDANAVQRLGHL